jgi:hypothetical protein
MALMAQLAKIMADIENEASADEHAKLTNDLIWKQNELSALLGKAWTEELVLQWQKPRIRCKKCDKWVTYSHVEDATDPVCWGCRIGR